MTTRWWVLGLALFGCASEVDALGPGGGAGDAGVPGDAGARGDAGPATCGDIEADRAEAEHLALLRLGLDLSPTVVEGRLEAWEPLGAERRRARLTVTRVHRGHAFLLGQAAFIEADTDFFLRADLPGEVIVGLPEPGLPTRDLDDAPTFNRPIVTMSAERRDEVADLLGYPAEAPPFVATVEVLARDEDRATLRVGEALAGELPNLVQVNWGRAYVAPYPEAGPARYIASFSYLSYNEPSAAYIGTISDWRPADAGGLAAARAAIAAPRPPVDAAALLAFREAYGLSWTFHRAPRVVATQVTGIAGECCTGAGGTYVQHELTYDFRGDAAPGPLHVGGHGYYPEEVCGDALLLATDGLFMSPIASEAFACPIGESLTTGLPTIQVRAMRADDPTSREEVAAWIAAQPPLYHTRALEEAPGAPIAPGEHAPWSSLRSVPEALSFGRLALVEVIAVEPLGAGHRIVVQTNLTPYEVSAWPQRQAQLTPRCADPRLLEVGSRWLLPYAQDPAERDGFGAEPLAAGAVFFVPGAIFGAEGPAERVMHALQSELR